jgi:hypothetical protein
VSGVAGRLRARLLREIPVWGLRAPAKVRREGDVPQWDCEDPDDEPRARGFVDAAAAMPAMDLARRTWSGRLAELLGERAVAGVRAPELDRFVRTLGFRRDAESMYRGSPHRDALVGYAAGVNGWIDAGAWTDDPFWGECGSRPRLWAPSDSLLLGTAPAEIDSAAGLLLVDPAARATWPEPWDRRLRALWAALGARDLRAEGGLGAGADTWTPATPRGRGAPTVVPVQVLEGGDNHRYRAADGAVRRLRARRHDLPVRGGGVLHPWVRAADVGPLVSDLLRGADGPVAPAGAAFAWRWPTLDGPARIRPREPLSERSVPRPLRDLPPVRLVPLRGGA